MPESTFLWIHSSASGKSRKTALEKLDRRAGPLNSHIDRSPVAACGGSPGGIESSKAPPPFTIERYTYDADGTRRKRVDGNGTIHYLGAYERNVGDGNNVQEVVTKYYVAQLGTVKRLVVLRRRGTPLLKEVTAARLAMVEKWHSSAIRSARRWCTLAPCAIWPPYTGLHLRTAILPARRTATMHT